MRVQDYDVLGVTGAVDTVALEKNAAGAVVSRTYRWSTVPRDGKLDVRLSRDAASALAALPTLRPRELLPDEGIGPLISGVIDALIRSAGVFLLLWAITSAAATRSTLDEKGRSVPIVSQPLRSAMADVLTIGGALLFLRPYADISGIGVWVANGLTAAQDFATRFSLDPSLVGRWVASLVIAGGGFAFAFGFRFLRLEFLTRAAVVVALGAATSFVISTTATISAIAIVPQDTEVDAARAIEIAHAARTATWLVGAAGLAVLVFLLGRSFGVFLGRRNRLAVTRRRWHRAAWAVVVALALAVPAGTAQQVPTTQAGIAKYVESTVNGLASLLAFALPLVAVVAIAALLRAAWFSRPWERTMPVDASGAPVAVGSLTRDGHLRWLAPKLARALVAGFVVGTAGIFVPVPFVLSLLLFGLLLRPTREVVALVRAAPALRSERRWVVGAQLGDDRAATRLDLVGRSSSMASTELASEDSVWLNVRLALRAAAVLQVPLLLIYLWQYPFASMTQQDQYYLQRLIFNIATYVGTWLTMAVAFALLFEYLRGVSGVRKGLWFAFAILAVTVPWQLISGLATTLSPAAIGIHVFEVVTFLGLLGAIFDLRLIHRAGKVRLDHPREMLKNLGAVSGMPDLAASIGLLLTAVATTIASLLTGEVTQLLTRVVSAFLPVPTK